MRTIEQQFQKVTIVALLAGIASLGAAVAQTEVGDKPPPSANMFESTRPPASDAESAAVTAALQALPPSDDPALFVAGYLVDPRGMTLYVFDRDRPGISTCYRACEKLWPPLLAGLDDAPRGEFGIVERLDGSRQWSWRGQPLYYWPSDKRPGDVTGDNVSGVWHIVPSTAAEPPKAPPVYSEY